MFLLRRFKMSNLQQQISNFLNSNKQIRSISNGSYEEAIEALNNLQSNATYIQMKKTQKLQPDYEYNSTLLRTQIYLLRSGITLDELDHLSVIHIAGTKGKGSTGAYCESILRHHDYKTGFYTSPHLVEVRERIQINGKPIEKDVFAKYFWHVYQNLQNNKEDEQDMPLYFRFLTVLAFNVFIKEKVDVAVVEVGIGGEYDCTNILRKVPIVAITSLGIDHVSLLGNSIEKIAWQKSGIMKKDCKAFTVPQDPNAMDVLQQRSAEKKCTLEIVSASMDRNPLRTYQQELNIALATALAKNWINVCGEGIVSEDKLNEGISNCFWPGRYHIIKEGDFTFYLDGAHTPESMKSCCEWFKNKTLNSVHEKVLVFNTIGERNSENLLKELYACNFDHVYFVPNLVTDTNMKKDFVNINIPENVQFKQCGTHKEQWLKLIGDKEVSCTICPTILDVLYHLNEMKNCAVLVTGSLHLVGGMLSILDPELNCKNMVQ